jgi:hypothetical protein
MEFFHGIIQYVWSFEKMPEDWLTSLLCPIFKKGDPLVCENYRGISLLCICYKVFSKILYKRLVPYVDNIVGEYQCGFCTGKSTVDHIFGLRQIMEKCHEFNIDLHLLFIDYKAAYDSIDRDELFKAMQDFDIPLKLINLVKMTLDLTSCRVLIQGHVSRDFLVEKGVRQGDALSCLLFKIVLERVIRKSGVNTRGSIFGKSVQVLAFADDIALVARSKKYLIEAFEAIEKEARPAGLIINQEKTKYFPVAKAQCTQTHISIKEYNFETVTEFIYLGSMFNSKNEILPEIRRRLAAANKAYFGLRHLLLSNFLSRKTKLLIYKTLIRPVLTYASETWTLTVKEERLLGLFERRVLRSVFGGTKENGVWRRRYNSEIYQLYKEPDVVHHIKISRLNWIGHVIRMKDNKTLKEIFLAKPMHTRRRGRPKRRFVDAVEEDCKVLRTRNWRSLAASRGGWRKLVQKALAHPGLARHE